MMRRAASGAVTRLARIFGLRGPRIMLGAQVFWLLLVLALIIWWGDVINTKSETIAELHSRLGMSPDEAAEYVGRTRRMVFWEAATMIALLFASTGFILWLYLKDHRRAKAIHAFFASLTHELRTPLTSIRLQAETIAAGLGSDSRNAELVHRLLEDTTRLESQVERTLELARVEGGGPVYVQPLPIRLWLDRFIANWKHSHREMIAINASLGDETVLADPAAMGVIFRNLLENSIRHSGRAENGNLEARLTARAENGTVVVEYHDNGNGYRGDSGKLGTIFFKGASSQGAGVGLYLIRILMERMGGSCLFRPGAGFGVKLIFKEGQADG